MADEKKSAPKGGEGPVKPDPPPKAAARMCREGDRAVPGLKRFRVRAIGAKGGATKKLPLYVLAPDRAAAEARYLDAERPDLEAAGFLKERDGPDGKKVPPVVPELDVLELID